MRLLITNDDGIHAPGLRALVKALRDLGDVVVVAPDREQSGVGASFTLHHPVRLRRVHSRGVRRFAVDGTPADAVILALDHLLKDTPVDAVISGINHGTNLGMDVFLSGTVGAAMHGQFRGIPSLAIAMPLRKRLRYTTAAQVARALVPIIASGEDVFKGMLFNVTVPNLPLERIRGVDITNLRQRSSKFEVTPGNDGRHDYFWLSVARPKREDVEPGTDVWSLREKRISITPLQADTTAYGVIDRLGNLRGAVESIIKG